MLLAHGRRPPRPSNALAEALRLPSHAPCATARACPCSDDPETLREQLKEVIEQEQAGKTSYTLK